MCDQGRIPFGRDGSNWAWQSPELSFTAIASSAMRGARVVDLTRRSEGKRSDFFHEFRNLRVTDVRNASLLTFVNDAVSSLTTHVLHQKRELVGIVPLRVEGPPTRKPKQLPYLLDLFRRPCGCIDDPERTFLLCRNNDAFPGSRGDDLSDRDLSL